MRSILSFGYFSANVEVKVEFDVGETDVKRKAEKFSSTLNRIDNGSTMMSAKDRNP